MSISSRSATRPRFPSEARWMRLPWAKKRSMPRGRGALAAVVSAILVATAGPLAAQESGGPAAPGSVDRAVLDRVAVRFYAPETGGTSRPRFITERTLSFEARLVAM